MGSPGEVTRMLQDSRLGNREALDALIPLVYDELRRIAARHLGRERAEHTLQPTALVHEAYLKLVEQKDVRWQNRAHFFGIASQLMRRILVDHPRSRCAEKRGHGVPPLAIDEAIAMASQPAVDVIALDDALSRLSSIDPQQGRLVELRFFGGLSIEETAEVLDVSPATVKREWNMAKAWLHREIERSEPCR